MTNAQVALAWLLAKHPHLVPIPATRRIAYLEQNVAATQVSRTEAQLAELDRRFEPTKMPARAIRTRAWSASSDCR